MQNQSDPESYMRFSVRLWLIYGSFMSNLVELVRSGEVNQFI